MITDDVVVRGLLSFFIKEEANLASGEAATSSPGPGVSLSGEAEDK